MDTEIKQELQAFFKRSIPKHEVTEDEDIFVAGYVSSLFVMQMVLFCEKTFDITFSNQDLDIENFRTMNSVARLIEQRKSATNVAA